MLSLSTPHLASTARISAPRHRHSPPSKALSVSPPSVLKPSLLLASARLAPLEKRDSVSRFQLAAASGSLEPEIPDDDEDEDLTVAEETDSGEEAEYEEGEAGEGEEEEYEEEEEEEDREVRMVLKFIWMEKNIGLGLERLIPGRGSIPITPYYFWPRKDAWEELKTVLEERNLVTQKRMIILLNQATDVINLWQQSGAPTPTV